MTTSKLTPKQRLARWREAHVLLGGINFMPDNEAKITEILCRLPKRLPNEELDTWLLRSRSITQKTGAVIIPFPHPRFMPVTEFVRRAASSDANPYPLPDNGPLESIDSRFRLTVNKHDEWLTITIEALGLAADDYANCLFGLSSTKALENVIVTVKLDADGDGEFQILDEESVRKTLLNPIIGVIVSA
jgi:hypothetical protein